MEDYELDVIPYSLEQFCEHAGALYSDNDLQGFVQFVLCGIDDGGQVYTDVVRNRLWERDIPFVLINRDYDPVIGVRFHTPTRYIQRPGRVRPTSAYL